MNEAFLISISLESSEMFLGTPSGFSSSAFKNLRNRNLKFANEIKGASLKKTSRIWRKMKALLVLFAAKNYLSGTHLKSTR